MNYYMWFVLIRDRPFNLQGGGAMLVFFRSEFFFRTTRELEYLFFQEFNIRLYDKNSESDYFFSSIKIRIFFSATLGIRIFFLEKKHSTLPPETWKLNSPSLNRSDFVRHLWKYQVLSITPELLLLFASGTVALNGMFTTKTKQRETASAATYTSL